MCQPDRHPRSVDLTPTFGNSFVTQYHCTGKRPTEPAGLKGSISGYKMFLFLFLKCLISDVHWSELQLSVMKLGYSLVRYIGYCGQMFIGSLRRDEGVGASLPLVKNWSSYNWGAPSGPSTC